MEGVSRHSGSFTTLNTSMLRSKIVNLAEQSHMHEYSIQLFAAVKQTDSAFNEGL